MKRFLHLVLVIIISHGVAKSQAQDFGIIKTSDNGGLVKHRSENILYSGEDFYVSNIYPNPAQELIQIDYSIPAHLGKAELVIRNILGNKVSSYELKPENKSIKISIVNLKPGIYFHTLHLNNKSLVTRKLIVEDHI